MNTRKWTTTRKRPTAAEQRATAKAKAQEQCKKGNHTTTATFRPSETVCFVCGMVVYCPNCLNDSHLQPVLVHSYPIICHTHKNAEVQV